MGNKTRNTTEDRKRVYNSKLESINKARKLVGLSPIKKIKNYKHYLAENGKRK